MSHLKNVCMTYTEHFRLSFYIARSLFIGSLKAFVHALIPDVFSKSTTSLLENLKRLVDNSGCI